MQLRLTKTLLSQKPSPQSVLMALSCYLVLLIVFLINDQDLSANGHLVFEKGEYWRAFTTSLMHGDFVHLGHNTIFFTIFSVLLNHYFGFWIFPVLSFLAGGVINLIALKVYDPHIFLVGISGVVYFMAAFWMTLFVCLERHMSIKRRLIITTGVSLILLFPEVFEQNVSYLAHGLGFALGVLSGIPYFWINRRNLRKHEVWVEKPLDPPEIIEWEMVDSPSSKDQCPSP